MKQRTPLQRVLDWVEENKRPDYSSEFPNEHIILAEDLRAFIESIKEEEKQVVINTYCVETSQHESKVCDCKRKYDYTANFICDGNCK